MNAPTTREQLTPEEKAYLSSANLQLRIERLEHVAKRVIRSARRGSSAQDLVLRIYLPELARIVGEPLHTA